MVAVQRGECNCKTRWAHICSRWSCVVDCTRNRHVTLIHRDIHKASSNPSLHYLDTVRYKQHTRAPYSYSVLTVTNNMDLRNGRGLAGTKPPPYQAAISVKSALPVRPGPILAPSCNTPATVAQFAFQLHPFPDMHKRSILYLEHPGLL